MHARTTSGRHPCYMAVVAGASAIRAGRAGEIRWVRIDLAEAAASEDHQISPEQRYRIAVARQLACHPRACMVLDSIVRSGVP